MAPEPVSLAFVAASPPPFSLSLLHLHPPSLLLPPPMPTTFLLMCTRFFFSPAISFLDFDALLSPPTTHFSVAVCRVRRGLQAVCSV